MKQTSITNKYLPLFITVLMLAGLLFSRPVLSLAEGIALVYGVTTLIKQKHLFNTISTWSIAPIILFSLGIYQLKPFHWTDFDYLLTLAAYPSLVLFFFSLDAGQQKQVATIWVIAVLLSLVYPMGWYLFHIEETYLRYKQGQSLPTLMSSDHVRYGVFVCSALVPLLYQQLFTKKTQNSITVIIALAVVILSVRSAWAALLILALVYIIGNFKWQYVLAGLVSLIVFAFLAYKLIPTVEQKVNYTIYDWRVYPADKYIPDFSDGARRSINNVAWKTISEKHKTNLGWNEVPRVLQQEFQLQYPGTSMKYGWPFNQFLFWWMGAGLVGLILFSLWLFYPAFVSFKEKNYSLLGWTLVMAATCVVESTLNMQYGVFLHAWVIGFAFSLKKQAPSETL